MYKGIGTNLSSLFTICYSVGTQEYAYQPGTKVLRY